MHKNKDVSLNTDSASSGTHTCHVHAVSVSKLTSLRLPAQNTCAYLCSPALGTQPCVGEHYNTPNVNKGLQALQSYGSISYGD